MVRLPGHPDTLRSDIPKNPDGDAGAGEGVPHYELLVDAELTSELADLVPVSMLARCHWMKINGRNVLEELPQGLDKLEALAVHHPLGEAADVVVSW